MPLYEFECPKCHKEFEELVRNPQAIQEVACPTCGSLKVKRKLSTFASKVSGGQTMAVSGPVCAPGGT